MRKTLPLLILLLASACGQQGGERSETTTTSQDLRTFDVAEEAAPNTAPPPPPAPPPLVAPAPVQMRRTDAPAAPDIAPSAAPGVAFNYRYAFRLPAQQVASVQEEHAQACEKLGLDRCRITGMRYRLVNENDIEAMLAFKLEPSIARAFGKQGVEAVRRSDGMLVDSEISGVDVEPDIKAAVRNAASLSEDLRRVEAELARSGLRSEERARLQYGAQQLRQSIRANQANREDREESLATTPVVFSYGSGDIIPGFDTRSPMRDSLERASHNFIGGVGFLLVVLVTLLPWALLLALGWWIYRRIARHRKVPQTPETNLEEQAPIHPE